MGVLEKVNQTNVSPDLLGEVMEMVANLAPEERGNFVARSVRLFELLGQKGLGKKTAELSIAIEFRLTALAKLVSHQDARGWTLVGDKPGLQLIHADLVRAAAEEPVIEDGDGDPTFDPENFRARALGITEMQGEA